MHKESRRRFPNTGPEAVGEKSGMPSMRSVPELAQRAAIPQRPPATGGNRESACAPSAGGGGFAEVGDIQVPDDQRAATGLSCLQDILPGELGHHGIGDRKCSSHQYLTAPPTDWRIFVGRDAGSCLREGFMKIGRDLYPQSSTDPLRIG